MSSWFDTHNTDPTQRTQRLFRMMFSPTPLYYTDGQLPVAWDDGTGLKRWTPIPIKLAGVSTRQMEGNGATMTIGDAGNIQSALLYAGTAQGVAVTVWLAGFDITSPSQIPGGVLLQAQLAIETMAIQHQNGQTIALITLGGLADATTKLLPTRFITDLIRL